MSFVLRQGYRISWLVFFGLVLFAWVALYLMSAGLPDPDLADIYGVEFWLELCSVSGVGTGYGVMFLMWALMSAAMMMPTFVPTIRIYNDLTHTTAANTGSFAALIFGYLLIWTGFSAAAAGVQYILLKQELVTPIGTSSSLYLNALLLVFAGLYQFSQNKASCLSKCRAPLMFFMGNWRSGPNAALGMGLKLGLICLGCCWALMSLAFVGGAMNLLWMGLATTIMVIEKLPDIGHYITRPLGGVLIVSGIGTGLIAIL